MNKNPLKKHIIAFGCILALGGTALSVSIYSSMHKHPSTVEDGAETEKNISSAYQAASCGETLHYEISGYKDSDIVSTKWYVDGKLSTQSSGISDYVVKDSDDESFISYEVTTSDDQIYTGEFYSSALPVLYIDSEKSYNSFQTKTDTYTDVTIHMAGAGYSDETLYNGDAGIRLRGNSTSGLSKKPFKVKLDKKADLLGMGEQKHWVLLANAIDNTNMRNKLLYDFAGDIGADTSMQSENVTMIYNGEYMGVYQLCEQVRVGTNRVEIYNWEDAAGDVADTFLKELQSEGYLTKNQRKEISSDVEDELNSDYGWLSDSHIFTSPTLAGIDKTFSGKIDLSDYIDFDSLELPDATGGALVEMDFYTGASADLLTAYKQPYYFDTPENGRTYTALATYMKEYIQTIEYALHDTDFTYNNSDTHYQNTDEGFYDNRAGKRIRTQYSKVSDFNSSYEGSHYSELLDMDSAVVNFLVCEFSRNWDSMKNSVFMYKDIDGKLIIGPSWDFDWAWGNSMYNINTNFPTGWQTTDEYFANEQYYQTVQWNRYLIRDPYFLERVYEKYKEIRPTVIENMIKDGGLIDTYYANYKNASLANDKKWGGSMGTHYASGYETEVKFMKNFITTRVAWLDKQFASLETFRTSTGYYVTSDEIKIESINTDSDGYAEITASCTNANAAKISFQVNGTYLESADIVNGKAVIRIPDSALTTDKSHSNVIQVRAADASGNYLSNADGSTEGEFQNSISNYAVFDKDFSLTLTPDSSYTITASGDLPTLGQVMENTSLASFLNNFTSENINILDASGNVMTDKNALIATGCKVQRMCGTEVADELTVLIGGDVDCNGLIDVLDMELLQKSLLGLSNLSEISTRAALCTTGNDEVSIYEMEWIQKYLLGLL